MIVESQAKDLDVATTVQICCPNCNRDVTEAELVATKCSACDTSLAVPKQNVSVEVFSIQSSGAVF